IDNIKVLPRTLPVDVKVDTSEAREDLNEFKKDINDLSAEFKISLERIGGGKASKESVDSYAKGTKGHTGGLALVGEEGSELVINPDGSAYLTGNSNELRDLEAGSQVYTASETKNLLTNKENKIPSYAGGTEKS